MSTSRRQTGTAGLAMLALAGIGLASALSAVYPISLCYAELSLVILGWVVLLQTRVPVLDHVRSGGQLSGAAGIAVAVILAAQTVLFLAVPGPVPGSTP
jgi:hypothetical protein